MQCKKGWVNWLKNSIERKYGSDGNYGWNGNNGSNGKNDVDKATEAKTSKYVIIFVTDSDLSHTTFLPVSSTIAKWILYSNHKIDGSNILKAEIVTKIIVLWSIEECF